MLANDLDAVSKCEPLVRIGSNSGIQGGMSDCNTGRCRNNPSNVLFVAVPQLLMPE